MSGMSAGAWARRARSSSCRASSSRRRVAAATAVVDEHDDLLYGSHHIVQLAPVGIAGRPPLAVEAAGLLGICTHSFGGDLRRHEPIAEFGQHARLQRLAGDGAPVVAGAVHDVVQTGVAILTAQGIGAAAASADQRAGEKRAQPLHAVQSVGMHGAGGGEDVGILNRKLTWRAFAACHSASSTMREPRSPCSRRDQ